MSDHSDHDHARTFQADHPEPTTDAALVGMALRELLIEAGHYTTEEEQAVIARMQGASPANGAKLTARAWTDPGFRGWTGAFPTSSSRPFTCGCWPPSSHSGESRWRLHGD